MAAAWACTPAQAAPDTGSGPGLGLQQPSLGLDVRQIRLVCRAGVGALQDLRRGVQVRRWHYELPSHHLLGSNQGCQNTAF